MKSQYSPVESTIMGVPRDHAGIFFHAIPLTCRDTDILSVIQQPSLQDKNRTMLQCSDISN